MKAVLINTYDMGRQPFGIASAAAWLRRAGCDVACVDLAKESLRESIAAAADVIGFYLPVKRDQERINRAVDKLAETVRKAREEVGMSEEEFAEFFDLSRPVPE